MRGSRVRLPVLRLGRAFGWPGGCAPRRARRTAKATRRGPPRDRRGALWVGRGKATSFWRRSPRIASQALRRLCVCQRRATPVRVAQCQTGRLQSIACATVRARSGMGPEHRGSRMSKNEAVTLVDGTASWRGPRKLAKNVGASERSASRGLCPGAAAMVRSSCAGISASQRGAARPAQSLPSPGTVAKQYTSLTCR